MIFFYINSFLVVAIIALLLLLSAVWPPDSPWSPWWKTDEKMSRRVCTLGKITQGDCLYELGSGNGTTLFIAAKEFGATGVGIEIDPFRVWVSRISLHLHGVADKTKIVRKTFFDVSIADASVVYVYLVPKALKKLEKKFLKELKPGVRIVSLVYPIPYLPLIKTDKEHALFLYEIPNKKLKTTK